MNNEAKCWLTAGALIALTICFSVHESCKTDREAIKAGLIEQVPPGRQTAIWVLPPSL